MTEPIRLCDDHGAFPAGREGCPVCDARGSELLSGSRRRRLSKFTSGALRHFPDDVGLELDDHGWVDYDDLAAAVDRKYDWARPDHVAAVIATDPKGRFERTDDSEVADGTGGRVRASYGHSVDVDLESEARSVRESRSDSRSPSEVRSTSEDVFQGEVPAASASERGNPTQKKVV